MEGLTHMMMPVSYSEILPMVKDHVDRILCLANNSGCSESVSIHEEHFGYEIPKSELLNLLAAASGTDDKVIALMGVHKEGEEGSQTAKSTFILVAVDAEGNHKPLPGNVDAYQRWIPRKRLCEVIAPGMSSQEICTAVDNYLRGAIFTSHSAPVNCPD